MIKVGLTGGIGTGKSLIARIFSELQVPVYFADIEAKKAYSDATILKGIKQSFGNAVFENNNLSYKKLAQIVFNDISKLNELNSIIHPFVMSDFEKWITNQIKASYIIMESAILYETSYNSIFDKIITVTAPEEMCIERVIKRDKVSRVEVLQRMSNQISNDIKNQKTDFVIFNDNKKLLLPQVLYLHNKILKLSKD